MSRPYRGVSTFSQGGMPLLANLRRRRHETGAPFLVGLVEVRTIVSIRQSHRVNE